MTTSTQAPSLSRDRVLAAWWDSLVVEDRLDDLFDRPPRTFEQFRTRLAGRPVYAAYTERDDGVDLGAILWGIPWFAGIKISLWLPATFRRTKAGLGMVEDLLKLALVEYPTLVALAKTPGHARLYRKYGFDVVTIPGLVGPGDLALGWITTGTWRRRTKEMHA